MRRMTLWALAFILSFACGGYVQSQSLIGHVYINNNIMEGEISKILKEAEQQMDSLREDAISKKEKELNRKLKDSEIAELDKQLTEAQQMMKAMKEGTKIKIGMEFKSETDVVASMKITMDDEVMKKAGISWLKRKALKAALAVMPKSEKGTYMRKGNLIIIQDKKGSDTLRISEDGKYLYGTFDKKTKYKLTRTK